MNHMHPPAVDEGVDEGVDEDDDVALEKEKYDAMEQADVKTHISSIKEERRQKLMRACLPIRGYDYDEERGEWAELLLCFSANQPIIPFITMMEAMAHKIIIRQTKGIRRCMLGKSSEVGIRHLPSKVFAINSYFLLFGIWSDVGFI